MVSDDARAVVNSAVSGADPSTSREAKEKSNCIADRRTDGDQNRIRIEGGFESQRSVSQRSIQRDIERPNIPK